MAVVPVLILLTSFIAGFAGGMLWAQRPRRKKVVRPRCPACQRFLGRRAVHTCPKA